MIYPIQTKMANLNSHTLPVCYWLGFYIYIYIPMIPPCTARDEEVVKYQTHQFWNPQIIGLSLAMTQSAVHPPSGGHHRTVPCMWRVGTCDRWVAVGHGVTFLLPGGFPRKKRLGTMMSTVTTNMNSSMKQTTWDRTHKHYQVGTLFFSVWCFWIRRPNGMGRHWKIKPITNSANRGVVTAMKDAIIHYLGMVVILTRTQFFSWNQPEHQRT